MQSQSLKDFLWEKRVLILVSTEEGSSEFEKQKETLATKDEELQERDLILILLKEDSLESPNSDRLQLNSTELRNELNIAPTFEGVILIGKDGGVKMREEFYVKPERIFDLIDSMPMRRAEMKN